METQNEKALIEKDNISNSQVDEIILNKSNPNITAKINENEINSLSFSKKSISPQGKIRAYKNKYNSPEINRLKQTDKNKMVLDIKYFKKVNNSNNNKQILINQPNYVNDQHSINNLDSQDISRKIILKEKRDNKNINYVDNNMNNIKNLNTVQNNIENFDNINSDILNNEKVLQKSKSLNEFYLQNKVLLDGFDKYKKIKKDVNLEFIKINFPKKNIIKNKSIELIPGNFEIINSNNNNKNLFMNNSDRQIINQENIIINNGFVNMNNNYYLNNNNINNNIKNIDDNDEIINNNINKVKNNNINYKNDIIYNRNNFFDSKLINLDIINKSSNNFLNMNYNLNNKFKYENKQYINPKILGELNNQAEYNLNYNKEYNPLYKSENIFRDNFITEAKQSNLNLEENNFEPNYISHSPRISLKNNFEDFPDFNYKRIEKDERPFINKKLINNNYSRNENILKPIPNPQYFHPNFHPNIPFQYISILKIQYPVQIMIKKSPKLRLVKHKLIQYYPPKTQIEIRPCLIFEPLYKKIRKNKKIPKDKNKEHKKIKHRRPVFKIPPFKKASLSQGKSLNFIHKYYDENFILEEEDDEEDNNVKGILHTERQRKEKDDINNDKVENININLIQEDKKKELNKIMNNINISINKKEEKKNEIVKNIKNNKNNLIELSSNKNNKNGGIKEKNVNKMKIPIRNDMNYRKNKTDRILLINIKKKKRSPLKEMINNKKNIQTIFSLNEVKQRFNSLNNSLRGNSTSMSIEKSRDNTLNTNSKSKIVNKKEINKNKNIKIINYIPKKKLLQKSNSFRSKNHHNNCENSYKNLTIKKILEKNNLNKGSYKKKVVKIDLSKI